MPDVRALRARLDGLTIRDAARLGRRLRGLRDGNPALAKIAEQFAAAEALIATRVAAVPTITYPDLPVSERRDEIAAAISEHQVVVVAGETGSGKTTQLPKICLELGRGIRGTIGHTQPRRLAARTVAQRIADELQYPARRRRRLHRPVHRPRQRPHAGQADDRRHPARRDPARPPAAALRHADPRRGARAQPQHRLPARLSARAAAAAARPQGDRHVGDDRARSGSPSTSAARPSSRCPAARIRSRSGTARWKSCRPRDDGEDPDDPDHEIVRTEVRDQTEAIVDAVRELEAEPPGDVLVFLSGEREIRDTAEALRGVLEQHRGAAAVRAAADRRAAEGLRAAHRPARRARHQRRRDVADRARASATSSTPAPPASRATAAGPRCSGCRSSRSRRRRPRSAPAAADVSRPASASGSTRSPTSSPGRATPIPRSCGPTWPRSSCRWRRCSSATSRTSRSSIRPTSAASATACSCCRNSARSTPAVPSPTSAGGSRSCRSIRASAG